MTSIASEKLLRVLNCVDIDSLTPEEVVEAQKELVLIAEKYPELKAQMIELAEIGKQEPLLQPYLEKMQAKIKEGLTPDDLLRIIEQGGIDSLTSEEIARAVQELKSRAESDPKLKAQIIELTGTKKPLATNIGTVLMGGNYTIVQDFTGEEMTTRVTKNGTLNDIVFD